MFIRFVEYFLINILNTPRRRRAKQVEVSVPAKVVPPSDYTVLGHLIPDMAASANDLISRQLNEAGVVALSPEARMRHLYLLGATGTGKTNLLLRLIESDIKNKRAFCVVDLRGDLVDRILLRLAAAGPAKEWRERLLLVDLRNGEHATGFNPLISRRSGDGSGHRSGQGDAYTRMLLMLAVLKKQSESWGVQLEDTLRHSLMALCETGWSLLEVRPLLTNGAFRQQVMSGVQDSQVRAYFEDYDQLTSAEKNSRSSAALNKLSPLLSVPALRQMFGQRQGFSFGELLDTQPGMIILISLGVDRLHDAARLAGGLLISSLQTAIMARVDQPERERVPCQLYVDEFECMASDKFEEMVAEGRRFRVGLTLSHQNLSQLPLNLRHVIRNNVHTQVYFQTGALDAGELAKEIGQGKSSAEVRAALMSQGVGEAYLVRRGQSAARMRTLRSDDPLVEARRLQALRAASFSTYARLRSDIERELQERETELRHLAEAASPSFNPASGGFKKGAVGTAVYEIRHDKLAHFGPNAPPEPPAPEPPAPQPAAASEQSTERLKRTLKPDTLKPKETETGASQKKNKGGGKGGDKSDAKSNRKSTDKSDEPAGAA